MAIPKPLVPVDDVPIIEIILHQLKRHGITDIIVSIGHKGEILAAFLGDGRKFGLKIEYVRETSPLGTVGPIRLIKDLPENFLMMNGDVLTDLDYSAFIDDHIKKGAEVSIASYTKTVTIELGVMKTRDQLLYDYLEKPKESFQVSMGIYGINRKVLDVVPTGHYFDFPSMVMALLKQNRMVRSYPFNGMWMDIGNPSDYQEAQRIFKESRDKLYPNLPSDLQMDPQMEALSA